MKMFRYVFTIGDECVYVWIVKTGQCLRLINQISHSNDQQTIVSMAINPHNRLQVNIFFILNEKRKNICM